MTTGIKGLCLLSGEFDGDRLTIRLSYADRTRLKALAKRMETTEAELAREGIKAVLSALDDE